MPNDKPINTPGATRLHLYEKSRPMPGFNPSQSRWERDSLVCVDCCDLLSF